MKRILITEKRKKAKELRAKGWSIRKVASTLVAGKDSVSKWAKMSNEDIERDERGWKKGRLRGHTEEEENRIIVIRKELEEEESFFFGADVVMKNYEHKYGEKPKKWFVEKVLRENGLTRKRRPKVKGRSKYIRHLVFNFLSGLQMMQNVNFRQSRGTLNKRQPQAKQYL